MTPAGTALEPAVPEEAEDASPTLRLPAFRRRGPGLMTHAARGLPVTPWFAAATGFVVAAGLWIYSPHADLQFPPSAVGRVPCAARGCGVTTGQGHGALATTKGQKIAPPKATRMSVAQSNLDGGTAAAHLKFGYRVLWQSQGKFGVLFTLSGKHVPRAWKLTFALPGDEIIEVTGAAWHPSGSYGGTASWPAAGSPWQPAGPEAGSGDQTNVSLQPGISFLVVGAGTPVVPTSCSFNRASCTFS
jgi:hypothetical protein